MAGDEVQTSIRLPRELLKRANLLAVEAKTSLAAIVTEALEEYLENGKP